MPSVAPAPHIVGTLFTIRTTLSSLVTATSAPPVAVVFCPPSRAVTVRWMVPLARALRISSIRAVSPAARDWKVITAATSTKFTCETCCPSINAADTKSVLSGNGIVTIGYTASASPTFSTSMSNVMSSPTITADVLAVTVTRRSGNAASSDEATVVKLTSLPYAVPAELLP